MAGGPLHRPDRPRAGRARHPVRPVATRRPLPGRRHLPDHGRAGRTRAQPGSSHGRTGARHLVLASRRGAPRPDEEAALRALRRTGVEVRTARCDVARGGDLARLLTRVRATMPPLRGVATRPWRWTTPRSSTRRPRLRAAIAPKAAGGLEPPRPHVRRPARALRDALVGRRPSARAGRPPTPPATRSRRSATTAARMGRPALTLRSAPSPTPVTWPARPRSRPAGPASAASRCPVGSVG